MADKGKLYNRTKALFSTRLIVLLDQFKEDFVSQLVAESIQDAVKVLYPITRFGRLQRAERKIVLDRIKNKIITYMEGDNGNF